MSLFTPTSSGSFRYGRFNGPLSFLEIIVERVLLVSCQNIVTLNAQIVGDETDHTFYWEQTAGPPVIWLEPQNQIMVMYEKNPSDTNGDCFFRFWIDRYTQFQQYRDLIVSGSARDDVVYTPTVANTGLISQPFTAIFQTFPDFTYSPAYTIDNPNKIFSFNLPNFTPAIAIKNVVYEYTSGGLIEVQQLSPTDKLFLTPETGKFYVVRYYFNLVGIPYDFYYESSPPFYVNADNNSSTTLDTGEIFRKIGSMSNYGSVSFFQTAIVELSILPNEENVYGFNTSIKNFGSSEFVSTQILSLLALPELPEDDVIGLNNTITDNVGFISIFQVQLSDGITVIG